MTSMRLRQRLAAQLLAGDPATSVADVLDRLLAVQGQDARGFRLAVRSRTVGLAASSVDAALDDGSAVVGWLNRGTLHLVAASDYRWLHRLTTPQLLQQCRRRLGQEGVSAEAADRAVARIRRVLTDGPATRGELAEHVAREGVRTAGQAMVHVLFYAAVTGLVVRGPTKNGEHAYVLVDDWLKPDDPDDREAALARLAERYLRGHGPAHEADLARWARIPLRDVRSGLRSVAPRLVELDDGLVDLHRDDDVPPLPPPRLLGQYDPVLLGWVSREDILGPTYGIVTDNGLFRPFAMVEGRAVAVWRLRGGRVMVEPFAPLTDDVSAALETDARAVEAFLAG